MKPPLRIKICGLTRPADVAACAALGVDLVGFVLAASPRQVTPARAATLAADLPASVGSVLVFHRATSAEVAAACAAVRPAYVQTEPLDRHGTPVRVPDGVAWLPVVHDGESVAHLPLPPGPVLLDSAGVGGRGVGCDRSFAAALAARRPVFLAGGLAPENVAAAIAAVGPVGVDVSSGVEEHPGRKDPRRIAQFVAAVRGAALPLALPA